MTLVGDFETTVLGTKSQDYTEVWASGLCELYTENAIIFHSITDTWNWLTEHSRAENIIVYYHNLKFDGSFWLDYFIRVLGLKQAITDDKQWIKARDMRNNTFKYLISDMGQFYTITVKVHSHIITFKDSLKLLPFSLKRIGESFKTKHKKLDMEYVGLRYAGCEITQQEKEYLKNDLYVIKEALEICFDEGHNKLTIGSCCLSEFKRCYDKEDYKTMFPDLTIEDVPFTTPYDNVDSYIRRSYRGGWCYLVKGAENIVYHNGTTADVNSLYPSMMSSQSGNVYPIGNPYFWKGDYIPDNAIAPNKYYFVRVRTRFYLKKGKLPFIQIKHSLLYPANEMLETSDYYDKKTAQYVQHFTDRYGNYIDTRQELVLTMTDYELIKKHYELVDFEIIDGCWFYADTGIFDEYINKYAQIKMTSKGAKRELAKLFLNNLYGKMASSDNSSFKIAYLKEDNTIGFTLEQAHDKKSGYIPIGSAITSYARRFTITAAQANFHGVDKAGFKYADTDSIHCDLMPDEIIEIKVHSTNFCAWKLESCWDNAIFARQKTYIEHVTHENLEMIDKPYYNIKCAGLNERSKKLIDYALRYDELSDDEKEIMQKLPKEAQEFIQRKMTLDDYKVGLTIPCSLKAKRIVGGVLLVENDYEMKGSVKI